MSARRFLSLYDKGGDDDMFSSDLSDTELQVARAGGAGGGEGVGGGLTGAVFEGVGFRAAGGGGQHKGA